MKTLLTFCVSCFALVLIARGEHYSYTRIPPFDHNAFLGPTGINNKGDIVGIADTQNYQPAAFRYSGGVTTFLPTTVYQRRSEGLGINNAGTVVGYGDTVKEEVHAVYATLPGSLIDFDSNPNRSSEAVAINDSNYVVGFIGTKPMLGNTSGWMISLSDRLGDDFKPTGINNLLDVVGNGAFGGLVYNAWSKTITFMGAVLGTASNVASVINQNRMVAGLVGAKGYIYSAGSVVYFGNHIASITGINIQGDVVGDLKSGRAFVYLHSSGHFIDLNDATGFTGSQWTIVHAGGINDSGEICGFASEPNPEDPNGTDRTEAFKLTPGYILYPSGPPIVIGPQLPLR